MDVLQATVTRVEERELQLAREALAQGQPAVDRVGIREIEALERGLGGEARPAALHLDAAEALFRDGEERAPGVVDHGDGGFVAAVVTDEHQGS